MKVGSPLETTWRLTPAASPTRSCAASTPPEVRHFAARQWRGHFSRSAFEGARALGACELRLADVLTLGDTLLAAVRRRAGDLHHDGSKLRASAGLVLFGTGRGGGAGQGSGARGQLRLRVFRGGGGKRGKRGGGGRRRRDESGDSSEGDDGDDDDERGGGASTAAAARASLMVGEAAAARRASLRRASRLITARDDNDSLDGGGRSGGGVFCGWFGRLFCGCCCGGNSNGGCRFCGYTARAELAAAHAELRSALSPLVVLEARERPRARETTIAPTREPRSRGD